MTKWKICVLVTVMVMSSGFVYAETSGPAISIKSKGAPLSEFDQRYAGKSAHLNRADTPALPEVDKLEGATPFMKVRELFNKGIPATREDLTGWKLGRMFSQDGKIIGALLVGKEVLNNAGPLFDPKFNVFPLDTNGFYPIQAITYFDEITPKKIEEVNARLKGGWTLNFPAASCTSVSHAGEKSSLEVRVSSGYIVEKWTGGNMVIYTYYFRDVTPGKK